MTLIESDIDVETNNSVSATSPKLRLDSALVRRSAATRICSRICAKRTQADKSTF
jgi:hypothetical protein